MSEQKKHYRIRIVNETGIGYHTKVTDADTGEDVPGVGSIDVRFDANEEVIVAHLHVHAHIIDILADAEITTVCPYCQRPLAEEVSE